MAKDTLERATEPNLNLKYYLKDTYLHPVFKEKDESNDDWVEDPSLVPVTKNVRIESSTVSSISGEQQKMKSLSMERFLRDYD